MLADLKDFTRNKYKHIFVCKLAFKIHKSRFLCIFHLLTPHWTVTQNKKPSKDSLSSVPIAVLKGTKPWAWPWNHKLAVCANSKSYTSVVLNSGSTACSGCFGTFRAFLIVTMIWEHYWHFVSGSQEYNMWDSSIQNEIVLHHSGLSNFPAHSYRYKACPINYLSLEIRTPLLYIITYICIYRHPHTVYFHGFGTISWNTKTVL